MPRSTAAAKSWVVMRNFPWRPSESPWKNWARIAPELPWEPMMARSAMPRLAAWMLRSLDCRSPSAAEAMVRDMLVPVSASGTG